MVETDGRPVREIAEELLRSCWLVRLTFTAVPEHSSRFVFAVVSFD